MFAVKDRLRSAVMLYDTRDDDASTPYFSSIFIFSLDVGAVV